MSLSRESGAETGNDAGAFEPSDALRGFEDRMSVLAKPAEHSLENEGCDSAANNHHEQDDPVCLHFSHAGTVASRPMNCTQKEG